MLPYVILIIVNGRLPLTMSINSLQRAILMRIKSKALALKWLAATHRPTPPPTERELLPAFKPPLLLSKQKGKLSLLPGYWVPLQKTSQIVRLGKAVICD